MQRSTSEGGKYFQSMEKQAQTLNGQLSTLKDNANQLLGSLTSGLSEDLRANLLPLANNIIGELQEALETGGMNGLTNAALKMVPDLIRMMSKKLEDAVPALAKFAPKLVKKLGEALPDAVKSLADIAPELTDALFQVATQIVTGLIGMFPELAPALFFGILDMIGSLAKGVIGMIGGIFDGVEQMVHQGQEKVMGAWVDKNEIAKYNLDVDVEVNTETAKSEIESAYSEIKTAIEAGPLTDNQKSEILSMIDQDYQAVYDKLISFGMSPADAEVLAATVSANSAVIQSKLAELNVEADPQTVYQWMVDANDSRIALREILKSQGLSESDIAEIETVFDEMQGTLKESTPNIAEEIFSTLTDGLADDPEGLKDLVKNYVTNADTQIDEAFNEKVAELNPEDEDYAEKLAALKAEYETAKQDLQSVNAELLLLVDTFSNASTTTVESNYERFAEIERMVDSLEQRLNGLTEDAAELGEIAYNTVRSGVRTDEATVNTAVKYKVTEFALDKQSAEDAYTEAMQELNRDFTEGKYTKEEYNNKQLEIANERDAKIAEARAAYEAALREIFGGLAESMGEEEIFSEIASKVDLANALSALATSLSEADTTELDGLLSEEMINMLAGHMDLPPEQFIENADTDSVIAIATLWGQELLDSAAESLAGLDNTQLLAAYQGYLEEGAFTDTSFDTTEPAQQVAAMFSTSFTQGAEQAAPDAQAAGETVVDNAEAGMANSFTVGNGCGDDLGRGYVSGIDSWCVKAYNKAYALSQAASRGLAAGQDSHSPSKIAIGLGHDFGDGYTIGLQASMARAARMAKMLSGEIVTAADLQSVMRVNIPNLQQEIMLANEQSDRPVSLYVNGRELGRVMAYDNQRAQNAYNRSVALGVGK